MGMPSEWNILPHFDAPMVVKQLYRLSEQVAG